MVIALLMRCPWRAWWSGLLCWLDEPESLDDWTPTPRPTPPVVA